MLTPVRGAQFKRDVKLAQKRGKDMVKLKALILLLLEGDPLPPRYKDHPLGGEWRGFRDAHIEPDWLLIYRAEATKLHLVRTGTHADLF
ncbi:MAG: type II toxin-antitoxin system YafQ family toxin [Acidobacteria bacterium]|nr:type II toxin-antitoxin system YafQ family toxin [Acidobacteriota bacterium]